MTRGIYNNIQEHPEYNSSEKHWHITLDQSMFFWYDLIVDPPEGVLNAIKDSINNFKNYVNQTNEKKFIYFFTSRKKVRFNINKQPRTSFFNKRILFVYFLVGSKNKKIGISYNDTDGIPKKVRVDEKFIYFSYEVDNEIAYSIHDFIKIGNISLGIESEIHYVGITADPVKRTLSRSHRGYADMLYNVSTSENDIFLTISTFKVMSHTKIASHNIDILTTNSMVYDIHLDKEGAIIEKSLIHYFDTKCQEVDKNAKGEFKNLFLKEMKSKNINSVSFHLEMNESTEYDVIGSRYIPPNVSHSFMWELNNNQLELTKFNSEIELLEKNKVFCLNSI
ncbi:hypothetical protein [Acinetobacter wuhouensis]|uniref:Uncharacterized protein n=1 Tax=Acinetobacter wuhouensis TaxID=1879050 RepID=A0A4Q7AKV2_9GAMM|nr:hypothetical protein [Acinetobacter wuhouensis]RZG47722.1 hypothetical protein EXU28_05150 [Acinetobacter wuhouensis]RZG74261.1 hypothetical protein EXU29_05220 [Acinetobacter wuhouensis]